MKTKFLFLPVSVVMFLFFAVNVKAQVNTGDSLALVDLYNSTGGPNWKSHTNWLTTQPVSTWYGITVQNNRVVRIALGYNRMTGTLPQTLGNIDNLQVLSLRNNYTSLTGPIPSSIGNLHRLTLLDLNTNGFTGSLPYSIGSIDSLQTLNLSTNSLSGSLPPSMGKLKKLINCNVSSNATGIGHISGNGISGKLPDSLGFCTSLVVFDASYNSLTGSLPATFKNLTNLATLVLTSNGLSGALTDVFADSTRLTSLELGSNQLSGSIPVFFSRFKRLQGLVLGSNKFTGGIPAALSQIKPLVQLDLSLNALGGTIPAQLATMPTLGSLNVSSCGLTGTLPPLFRNFSYPGPYLNVTNNSLTFKGNPQWDGSSTTAFIYVDSNRFTFDGLEYLDKKYYFVSDEPQAPLAIHVHNNELAVSAGGTLRRNTYLWYKAGTATPVTIKGDSTYQPATSGQYYVNISNSVVDFLTLTSDTVTYTAAGIIKDAGLGVSISPNPARGMISIHGLDEKSDAKITIADVSGYVWMRTMSRQQSAIRVDVSRLKAGNYLLNVNDGKEVKTVMFVKE